ncbi:MAG: alpha/beta hydrolase [Flavobacteriales bacterium]|jgi:proline iminopeptidase|nr:alpha/beta hydrolase [Flavobacteriales bacterium]
MKTIKSTKLLVLTLLFLGLLTSCDKKDIVVGDLVPKTVVDDLSLPSFTLSDGTKLHLETFGNPSNPVVIILHGGPGNSYRPYLRWKSLSDDYFLVFWDQRGAGLSERSANDKLTPPQYLKDLHEIGNHFSPSRKLYLIGHSWGGAYASYYIQKYPNRVKKTVLLEPGPLNKVAMENTNPTAKNFFDKELQAFLNNSDYLIPQNDEKADYFRMTSQFEEKTHEDTDTRQGYRCNYFINEWRGLWDKSYSADFTKGIKENFKNDVLFIAGTSERLGVDYQKNYQAPYFNLYNNKIMTIEGASHYEILAHSKTLPSIRDYFQN